MAAVERAEGGVLDPDLPVGFEGPPEGPQVALRSPELSPETMSTMSSRSPVYTWNESGASALDARTL